MKILNEMNQNVKADRDSQGWSDDTEPQTTRRDIDELRDDPSFDKLYDIFGILLRCTGRITEVAGDIATYPLRTAFNVAWNSGKLGKILAIYGLYLVSQTPTGRTLAPFHELKPLFEQIWTILQDTKFVAGIIAMVQGHAIVLREYLTIALSAAGDALKITAIDIVAKAFEYLLRIPSIQEMFRTFFTNAATAAAKEATATAAAEAALNLNTNMVRTTLMDATGAAFQALATGALQALGAGAATGFGHQMLTLQNGHGGKSTRKLKRKNQTKRRAL